MLSANQNNLLYFAKLIVLKRDGTAGGAFTLRHPIIRFGRDDTCFIRLRLPEISRFHAEIQFDPETGLATIIDKSSNGTLLNGEYIDDPVQLNHGDIISITDRQFRFEFPPEGPRPIGDAASQQQPTVPAQSIQSVFGKETPRKARKLSPFKRVNPPKLTSSSDIVPVALGSAQLTVDSTESESRTDTQPVAESAGSDISEKEESSPQRRRAVPLSPSTTPSRSPKKNGTRAPRKDGGPSLLKNVLEKNASKALSSSNPFLVTVPSQNTQLKTTANQDQNKEHLGRPNEAVSTENPVADKNVEQDAQKAVECSPCSKTLSSSPRKASSPLKRLKDRTVSSPTKSPKRRKYVASPKPSPSKPLFTPSVLDKSFANTPLATHQILSQEPVTGSIQKTVLKTSTEVSSNVDFKDDIFWAQIERFAATAKTHETDDDSSARNIKERADRTDLLADTSAALNKTSSQEPVQDVDSPTSKRRVRFGPPLNPEIFRADHPPSSPISRGTRTAPNVIDGSSIVKSSLRKNSCKFESIESHSPSKEGRNSSIHSLTNEGSSESISEILLDEGSTHPTRIDTSLCLNQRLRDEIDQDMESLVTKNVAHDSHSPVVAEFSGLICTKDKIFDNNPTNAEPGTEKENANDKLVEVAITGDKASVSLVEPDAPLLLAVNMAKQLDPNAPNKDIDITESLEVVTVDEQAETATPTVADAVKQTTPCTTQRLTRESCKSATSSPLTSKAVLRPQGINRLPFKTPPKVPETSFLGLKETFSTPKSNKAKTNYIGMKETFKTPKSQKDIPLAGVKETLKTPKAKTPEPTLVGLKELVKTPRDTRSSGRNKAETPYDDKLEDLKHVINTPKPSGLEVKGAFIGIKETLKTPAAAKNSSAPSMIGIKETFRTPDGGSGPSTPSMLGLKNTMKTPKIDAEASTPTMIGVKETFKTPKANVSTTPVMCGLKETLNTPNNSHSSSPQLRGLKEMMKTPAPKNLSTPLMIGVKETLKTPDAVLEPSTPSMIGIKETLKTPRATTITATPSFIGVRETLKTPSRSTAFEESVDSCHESFQPPQAAETLLAEQDESKEDALIDMVAETPHMDNQTLNSEFEETLQTPHKHTMVEEKYVGVKETFKTPKATQETNYVGVKEIVKTPTAHGRSGVKDTISFLGIKETFKTPRASKEMNILGVKELMHESLSEELVELDGRQLAEMFSTPKASSPRRRRRRHPNSASQVDPVRIVTRTRTRSINKKHDPATVLEPHSVDAIPSSEQEELQSSPANDEQSSTQVQNHVDMEHQDLLDSQTGSVSNDDPKDLVHNEEDAKQEYAETDIPAKRRGRAKKPQKPNEQDETHTQEIERPTSPEHKLRSRSRRPIIEQAISVATESNDSSVPQTRRRRGRGTESHHEKQGDLGHEHINEEGLGHEQVQMEGHIDESAVAPAHAKRKTRKVLAETETAPNNVAHDAVHDHNLRHRSNHNDEVDENHPPAIQKRKGRGQQKDVATVPQEQEHPHVDIPKKRGKRSHADLDTSEQIVEPVTSTRRSTRRR